MRGPRKTKPVGVLTKALRVVDLLQDSGSPLSLHDIRIQAGINKSTALRLLAHLEGGKYLRRDERGGYSLGPKFLRLGSDYNVQAPLREMAREPLWELWRITQETVNLAVLDGFDVVYIDCLESPHDLRLVSNVGMRAVVYRTALGKALLAFQPAEQCERLIKSLRFETFTPHTVTSAFELGRELDSIRERVVDLLPVVRAHVYHRDFHGSFSLKSVLPALTGAGYGDLEIADGLAATLTLERRLFGKCDDDEVAALLEYCKRDTWGLVLLHRRLRELA